MKRADFCNAFCSALGFHEIPIGYVVKTPLRRDDGDAIALYVRKHEKISGQYRLEDDGETIAYLESQGVDFETETRQEALADLLKQYDAYHDESDNLIHTEYFSEKDVPARAVQFTALILRIWDLLLLATNRVRSTFKDDLLKLVEAQFGYEATIRTGEAIDLAMKDYIVDIIVQSPDGRALAIYAGTSELKALEALLFVREQKELGMGKVKAMLVLETAKPREINRRTLSRVMNSPIVLASMDGEAIQIKQKMADTMRVIN